jgi:transcriptional regulator of nitric oxide reductase
LSRFSSQQGQHFLINAIYLHHLKSSLAPVLSANKNNTGKIIVAVSTPPAKNVTSATSATDTIRITVENVTNATNMLRRKNRTDNRLSTGTVTNAIQHIPQNQSRSSRLT